MPTMKLLQGGGASPRRVLAAAAAVCGVLAALAAPALADRIITKAGETFTGTIVEDTPAKVVLKTLSGTVTIPRDMVKTVERPGATTTTTPTPGGGDTTTTKPTAPPPAIVPVPVDPTKTAEALQAAKSALVAGEWLKAGGLLEGLMALDEGKFPGDDRLAATGALVTCYLQIKDAQGAAKALARRAYLVTDANDKRRLMAAAEALRTVGTVEVGGKVLGRFEEVVQAAMDWKAGQCLADAKDTAAKAQRLNEMASLEKGATLALKKLSEADVYVPGYSADHRRETIEPLVQNILEAARTAVEYCDKERPELTRTRAASIATKGASKTWNDRARPYLEKRQATEDALRNLRPFCTKFEIADLYTKNAAAITKLMADLDEYQYYPVGTVPLGYGYYGYYGYSGYYSSQRLKIQLRNI